MIRKAAGRTKLDFCVAAARTNLCRPHNELTGSKACNAFCPANDILVSNTNNCASLSYRMCFSIAMQSLLTCADKIHFYANDRNYGFSELNQICLVGCDELRLLDSMDHDGMRHGDFAYRLHLGLISLNRDLGKVHSSRASI
jgi:hypothetical protein